MITFSGSVVEGNLPSGIFPEDVILEVTCSTLGAPPSHQECFRLGVVLVLFFNGAYVVFLCL